jgi:DNA-directed RNA polymerase subunit K/omega
MIYPTIQQLTKGKFNRYELVIATAKCARIVTDQYVEQRNVAEKMIANKETDRSLVSMINRDLRDEKAVKNAISRINDGTFEIYRPGEDG